jgi:DnaK suppressor protein
MHTPAQLTEFRAILTAKLTEAQADLKLLQDSFREALAEDPLSTVDIDFGGGTTEALTQAELQMLEARQIKYIAHLDAAMQRMDAGTYGICTETGKPIGADRLRLVPHATLSEEGKQLRLASQPKTPATGKAPPWEGPRIKNKSSVPNGRPA